jgi:hypothetical protein
MLKVECPQCRQWLHSSFLVETKEMTCPTCNITVPVQEVYVSAGSFSISRDVLKKHFFKYERLLKEAVRELDDLKKEGASKPYKISQDNINSFIDNLKEMLEGCREGFRIAPSEKHVNYFIKDSGYDGKLVNISMTGMCLNATDPSFTPAKGSDVSIEIKDGPHNFKVPGTVVWASKSGAMGVRFSDMAPEIMDSLLEYIKNQQ